MSKKLKYAVISLSLAAIVGVSAAASACTIKTKHPRAKITVEFNDKTYDLEFTLYRNMYPQTVQHFIELADEGFYDNMIIHNYTSTDWFTGSYTYNAESYKTSYSNSGLLSEYMENHSKEQAYYNLFNDGKLTPSVYKTAVYDGNKQTVSRDDALPNLIGEFPSNDHNIEKNALTETFGALKYYYYNKGTTNKPVTIKTSFNEILEHDYKYNCATSVFAIQSGSGSSYSSQNYCIFGQLRNDKNIDKLNELDDAIDDYISDELDGNSDDFTKSVTTNVDNLDSFAPDGGKSIEVSFTVTSMPLIIRTVKITKY